jgi:acyl-CoA synthetase (AMP-forming)/AMP-acid ligase II
LDIIVRSFAMGQGMLRILFEQCKYFSSPVRFQDKSLVTVTQIDYLTACYGVHCLNGIVTTANAAYAAAELEHQLKSSGSSLLITCAPLLKVAEEAAKAAGLSRKNILLLDIPGAEKNESAGTITTVEQLIREGERLPALGPLTWADGQGKRQPAFLCYSSGTSGLPVSLLRTSVIVGTSI